MTKEQTGQTSFSKNDAELVNELFKSLKSIKPAWKQAFSTKEHQDLVKVEWVKGLLKAGINTDDLINKGLEAARKENSDFFPNVGRFIEWCRPPELSEHRYRVNAEKEYFKRKRALSKLPASKDSDSVKAFREYRKKARV